MKRPFFLLFSFCLILAAQVSSCVIQTSGSSSVPSSGSSASSSRPLVFLTPLDSNNFTAYPVSLQSNEIKIIVISNYSEPVDAAPGWWRDAVIYQVHVRSFKDSDGDGNGDLQGLISKLDYVSNMGFDAIWTCPVFESPRADDGYDVGDYYKIQPAFGAIGDFKAYASAAAARGIRVVMDMVVNHTSTNCDWFKRSCTNDAVYKNWYVWTNASLSTLQSSGWQQAWGGGSASDVWATNAAHGGYYYGAFVYLSAAPDLNYFTPAVTNEVFKIGQYWLTNGATGYRLDAVRYLYEDGPGSGTNGQEDTPDTFQFLKKYEAFLKSVKSDAYTIGEVWTSLGMTANYYMNGLGLDECFNFDYQGNIGSVVNSANAAAYQSMMNSYFATGATNFFAPFLGDHDQSRIMNTLGGSYAKSRLAATLLLTGTGTPYVYYGEEIGMQDAPGNPAGLPSDGRYAYRAPMQWDNTANAGFTTGTPWNPVGGNADPTNVACQQSDTNSLLNYYKKLIALRHGEDGLRRGRFRFISNNNGANTLSYIRPGSAETVLVVANFSSSYQQTFLDFTGSGLQPGTAYSLFYSPIIRN